MNIGWRMEREEAIFENENNSNLESESNNRQQLSLNEGNHDSLHGEEESDEFRIHQHEGERASISNISHSHDVAKSSPEQVESKFENISAQKENFEPTFYNEEGEGIPTGETNTTNETSDIDLGKVNDFRDEEVGDPKEDADQSQVSTDAFIKENARTAGEQNEIIEAKKNNSSDEWLDEEDQKDKDTAENKRDDSADLSLNEENILNNRDKSDELVFDSDPTNKAKDISQTDKETFHGDNERKPNVTEENTYTNRNNFEAFTQENYDTVVDDDDDIDLLPENDNFCSNQQNSENKGTDTEIVKDTPNTSSHAVDVEQENDNFDQSTEKSDEYPDDNQMLENETISEQKMDCLGIGEKHEEDECNPEKEDWEGGVTSETKDSTLIVAPVDNKEEGESLTSDPKQDEIIVDHGTDVEESGKIETSNVEEDYSEMLQEAESDDVKKTCENASIEDNVDNQIALNLKETAMNVSEKNMLEEDLKETELPSPEKNQDTFQESRIEAKCNIKNDEIEISDVVMNEPDNGQPSINTQIAAVENNKSTSEYVTEMDVDEGSTLTVNEPQEESSHTLLKGSEVDEKAEDVIELNNKNEEIEEKRVDKDVEETEIIEIDKYDEEMEVINDDKKVEEEEGLNVDKKVEIVDVEKETRAQVDESNHNVDSPCQRPIEGLSVDLVPSSSSDTGASSRVNQSEVGNKETAPIGDKASEQVNMTEKKPECRSDRSTEVMESTSEDNSIVIIDDAPVSTPETSKTADNSQKENETMKPVNDSDDIIVMREVKKEADVDYHVPETIAQDATNVPVDGVGLKSEVVLVDEEQDSSISKNADDKNSLENGMGIQIAAVSGQQHQLHANASDTLVSSMTTSSIESEKATKSSSKSKTQMCIVCHNMARCKYNIVRNGDTKQLCGDVCFKKFRSNPNRFLQGEKAVKGAMAASPPKPLQPIAPKTLATTAATTTKAAPSSSSKLSPSSTETVPLSSTVAKPVSVSSSQYKTCHVCQVMNINAPQKFCNWKGFDFCGESCLAKFQATLNNKCSFCSAYIPIDMRASFCLKIGSDMRPFCKQRCYQEFKKNLRMCAYCQKDLLSFASVSAKVGMDSKVKEFCSWGCVKKLEGECEDVQIVSVKMSKNAESATCSVCKVQGRTVKHSVRFQSKTFNLCSDICLSAFQYTNKINVNKCDSCGIVCTSIEAQVHFIQFEGQTKRFCSDRCVNTFRTGNRKTVDCTWCGTKKANFDMIERLDEDNKFQLFCSLNCLSLYRVNLQAKSNSAVQCDQCKKYIPAQYHLTMSDASVRNFCCYACVMAFQSQFAQKAVPQRKNQPQTPSPTITPPVQSRASASHPHGTRSKGRQKAAAVTQAEPPPPPPTPKSSKSAVPVISDVVSLASEGDSSSQTQMSSSTAAALVQNFQKKGSLFTGDGKERIVIRAPSPVQYRNKSLQCRPVTQTKATSCRPHSQSKEVQTEKEPLKRVAVPVPVPIYVPMPTVMYKAPAPVLVPVAIPIPVPIFIPTTRKSANGILKAIKEIVERMPADPLEAELLMMAEAVAADGKKPGDSDTDSEQDACANDDEGADDTELLPASVKETNPLLATKRDGAGEEDMIQMALRMAEEMSGPIEDLESSVEPSVVKTESQRQSELQVPAFDNQINSDVVPSKPGRGRGAKRPGRGRPPASSRPKRQKTDPHPSYGESDMENVTIASTPQAATEPPPDQNHRLKFTFGVNAWKNWVIGKNAELERNRKAGQTRMRSLPTDILRCTMDELNYSLCFFIKEVRKPNGEIYSPDSIFYLCLGIQQYLYENGRIENIFTDLYFQRFTDALHELLKSLQPKVNSQGQMLCRIEEEHLWESKQLGAHSPYILLNTLVYFHTKHFILKTATEHMSLSFAQILKHLKKGVPVKAGGGVASKNVSLRFYCLANKKEANVQSKKGKDVVPVFEVTENFANPLRCPVKLYEFFLSKCPESIKNRNDIFYPVPERSCVPDSPVWYSTQSVDIKTMDKMLTRILLVREIQEAHLHAQAIFI